MDAKLTKDLIVNILIDNSVLVTELNASEKIQSLVKAFASDQYKQLKLSIHAYDGLKPQLVKDFDSTDCAPIKFDGFPLMNYLLKTVSDYTIDYLSKKVEAGPYEIHRPWMIVISSGLGFDNIDFFENFKVPKKEWQPVIFPFLLSKKYMTYELTKINQIKPFMVIKDNQIEALKEWLDEMIKTRLDTPVNETVKLDKSMFKGWTEL